jgi:hypothetical protein
MRKHDQAALKAIPIYLISLCLKVWQSMLVAALIHPSPPGQIGLQLETLLRAGKQVSQAEKQT